MTTFLNNLVHAYQQNGVAEHKHRHMRSLLLSTSVSKCYWAEDVLTTVLLINITPSFVVAALSPYTHLYGHSFDTPFLVLLGVYVLFSSLLRNEINCPPKLVNIFFLNVALFIKDIGVLPNVLTLSNMYHFLKKFHAIILLPKRISHFSTPAQS